ncbi:sensor domain-containing diguanylate cyclase [Enterovibrio sp. FF113]|uniref:sensor domain-containing diguanylate cyclase n=1 Tax=Enterovibrio sp. FF113 TaxID=3230010 RepID=UPI00352E4A10
MANKTLNTILILLCVAMLATSVGYSVHQANHVEKLNDEWHPETQQQLNVALEFEALERAFGYLGFIHHFKNYVLRRTDYYYVEATKSYWEANEALLNLLLVDLPNSDVNDIITIQDTLNAYFKNLNYVYLELKLESAVDVDKRVRVDDNNAREALIRLRAAVVTNLSKHNQNANSRDESKSTWSYVSTSLPLFVIVFLAIIVSVVARQMFHRQRETNAIFNFSPDGCLYADSEGNILRANKAVTTIFGYSLTELTSMKVEDLMDESLRQDHVLHREDFSKISRTRLMSDSTTEVKGKTKFGNAKPLSIAISSFEYDKTYRNIAIIRDLSAQNKTENDPQYDLLTSLRSRRAMEQLMDVEVKRAKRYGRNMSVLLINIDDFKTLNDNEGHTAGDEGLVMAADHLRNVFRTVDHIGRWGGDEFLVVCPELDAEDAIYLADRVCMRFAKLPFPWDTKLTMSIGISSMSPTRASGSLETLFDEADQALYSAKAQGRNRQQHFRELRRPKLVN